MEVSESPRVFQAEEVPHHIKHPRRRVEIRQVGGGSKHRASPSHWFYPIEDLRHRREWGLAQFDCAFLDQVVQVHDEGAVLRVLWLHKCTAVAVHVACPCVQEAIRQERLA